MQVLVLSRLCVLTRNVTTNVPSSHLSQVKSQCDCYTSDSLGGHFTWTTDAVDHCNLIQNLTQSARHLNQTCNLLAQ